MGREWEKAGAKQPETPRPGGAPANKHNRRTGGLGWRTSVLQISRVDFEHGALLRAACENE